MTKIDLLEMIRPYSDNVQIRMKVPNNNGINSFSDFEIGGFEIKRDDKGNAIIISLLTKRS